MRLSKKRLQAYILLLISTVLWGVSFIIVKPSLGYISPFNFLFTRYILASLLSLPVIIYYWKKIKVTVAMIVTVVALELIGTTLSLGLLYMGLAQTSAIQASLISTTGPLFVVLLGIFWLKEKQEQHEWIGTMVSFFGMVLIAFLPSSYGDQGSANSVSGNLLIIACLITSAFYTIGAKKYYKKIPKLFASSLSFVVGLVSCVLIAWWESYWSIPGLTYQLHIGFQHMEVWVAVVYMAIFGSIIPVAAFLKGQNDIEASEATVFTYLQPAFYLPLGALMLGETISLLQYLGLALVVGGFVIAEARR